MRLVFKPKEITMKENQRWIQGVLAISALAFSGLAASATTMLQMPTGGVTGTYYMIGSPLAQYINQHSSNLRVTPNTSGGGYENIRRVDAGQAQIGMTQPDTMFQAWNGDKPFTRSEEPTSELQSLMRISYAVFCLNKKKTYDKT